MGGESPSPEALGTYTREPRMSLTPPTAVELKTFRSSTGLSQSELANELGVSKRAIEEWEAGRRTPPAFLRLALAAVNAQLTPYCVG